MDEIFNIDLDHFSFFSFFGLLVFGVLLYFLFWLSQNYLVHFVFKNPVRKKKVIDILPAFITLFWCFYFLYVLYYLIRPFPFYGVIISLVIIYLARGYLRNLINGLFFRFKGNIRRGQKITINNHSGMVTDLKTFDLILENKNSERIIIPYATLAKEDIVLKNISADFCTHNFSIVTNSDITSKLIETEIKNSPWISSKMEVKVSRTRLDEKQFKYTILVHTLDEKYNYFVENDLRLVLNKK